MRARETRSYSSHGTYVWLAINQALIFCRSPDDSKIKQKMLYASSKDALRRCFVGIAAEIQGTDMSEVAHETGKYILSKVGLY